MCGVMCDVCDVMWCVMWCGVMGGVMCVYVVCMCVDECVYMQHHIMEPVSMATLVTHYLVFLLKVGHHDDGWTVIFPHHPPEVSEG